MLEFSIREIIERALAEDLGSGDITTRLTVPSRSTGSAVILARESGVIAGLAVASAVFKALDPDICCTALCDDGESVAGSKVIMRIEGRLQPILSGERTALNFLRHLSGIATQTAAWVRVLEGYTARLADTRKTTPGMRLLEKYAVRMGGGLNHRPALDSGILIKENHIRAAGGITGAVKAVRRSAPFTLRVEVEVTSLEELSEALDAGADIIMLDNMDLATMRKAVAVTGGRVPLEASGNVTLGRLKEIAATGVDLISAGALTHSSRSLDLSLLLEK